MKKLEKVNRSIARELFEAGEKVYILPCKVRLDSLLMEPTAIINEGNSLNSIIALYEYKVCNQKLGRHVKFYKEA